MADRPRRVLYVAGRFPEMSESYVRTELNAIGPDFRARVVSFLPAEMPYEPPPDVSHRMIPKDVESLVDDIDDFRPDVLHAHYLTHVPIVAEACRRRGLPFTVRTHSFDVIGQIFPAARRRNALVPRRAARVRAIVAGVRSDHCLGVLSLPFTRFAFERLGLGHKMIDCHPVIDHARFADRGPNGDGVMNVGPVLPKKDLHGYLDVAAAAPDLAFDLYPIGGARTAIIAENERRGQPVRIMPVVDHHAMPPEYKRHRWLLYTASHRVATCGWPMAVAEAQASGTGVCIIRVRPDFDDYVDGGGFVVDTLAEAREVVRGPVPEEIRDRGFEVAERSDIERHKHLLTGLWRTVAI